MLITHLHGPISCLLLCPNKMWDLCTFRKNHGTEQLLGASVDAPPLAHTVLSVPLLPFLLPRTAPFPRRELLTWLAGCQWVDSLLFSGTQITSPPVALCLALAMQKNTLCILSKFLCLSPSFHIPSGSRDLLVLMWPWISFSLWKWIAVRRWGVACWSEARIITQLCFVQGQSQYLGCLPVSTLLWRIVTFPSI